MTTNSLLCYPEHYIGFNKIGLLERHLSAAGFLGAELVPGSYLLGKAFHQFVPKSGTSFSLSPPAKCIHLRAVGACLFNETVPRFMQSTNLLILENSAGYEPLESYRHLSELLLRITGDNYRIELVCTSVVAALVGRVNRLPQFTAQG